MTGTIADLLRAMRRRDGVARTSTLMAEGHSRHRLAMAVDAGALMRVRRGWVSTPDADPDLVGAARSGVVLSCITQARRLGLWVASSDRPHVGAPAHGGGGKPSRVTVHWAEPPVPRHPDSLVDSIENVLVLAAMCQPYESARTIWESAFRAKAVSPQVMRGFPLGPAARRLLAEAWTHFDSGLETIVGTRLAWIGERILSQTWILGHRVDFLIGDRLVLQIDGGHHVDAQRTSDIAHDALLRLHGFHVIRIGYAQIMDDWPAVQHTILTALAQGLHRAA